MTNNAAPDRPLTEVTNHWWWRPGWRPGRHFYAFHCTFEAASQLHGLARGYQGALARVDSLDQIPKEWLHLTMCGVGFVDQITLAEIERTTAAVGDVLAETDPIVVTFSNAVVRPEAVYLPAQPSEPLIALHSKITETIYTSLGDRAHKLPEQTDGYRPHVSVAYVNSNGPAQPIYDALETINPATAEVTISELPLLVFNRDHKMYQWTERTPLPLHE